MMRIKVILATGLTLWALVLTQWLHGSSLSSPIDQHFPWGDVECDGSIFSSDVILILSHSSGAGPTISPVPSQTAGVCPPLGQPVQFGPMMGDVNCDGVINALDAFFDLRYQVTLPLQPSYPPNCPPTGAPVGYW